MGVTVFDIILFQSAREIMLPPSAQVLWLNFLYATISHPYGRHIPKGFSFPCLLPLAYLTILVACPFPLSSGQAKSFHRFCASLLPNCYL
jgi:hypothetical protein